MKRLIVSATDGIDITTLRHIIGKFIVKHRWTNEGICLVTSRKNSQVRALCSTLAQMHHRISATSHIGRTAEAVRDKMCLDADGAVILWDGKSRGTQTLIDKVERRDIPFAVHIL
jgi:hypothetical protein